MVFKHFCHVGGQIDELAKCQKEISGPEDLKKVCGNDFIRGKIDQDF